ncbi:MAG: helix-turn-helix transcriptional regulator [Bacteroidia bacterium]
MQNLPEYHLHQSEPTQLQFSIHAAAPYVERYHEHCMRPHQHTYFQFLWFEQAGQHYVDYEVIEHPAQSLIFLKPGQVHHFCPESANEGRLFHFNELFLHRLREDQTLAFHYALFYDPRPLRLCLTPEISAKIATLTTWMESELDEKSDYYRDQLYYLFHAFLVMIERLWQAQNPDPKVLDEDWQQVRAFQQLVEQCLDKFFNLGELSSKLGLSEKTLRRVCKARLGLTPANWIHQRRILEAKRLLSNTSLSSKEVGFQLGFEQATYFSKYFKKHTGLTPKSFQQSLR